MKIGSYMDGYCKPTSIRMQEISRESQYPYCREYFLPLTSICHIIAIKYRCW